MCCAVRCVTVFDAWPDEQGSQDAAVRVWIPVLGVGPLFYHDSSKMLPVMHRKRSDRRGGPGDGKDESIQATNVRTGHVP